MKRRETEEQQQQVMEQERERLKMVHERLAMFKLKEQERLDVLRRQHRVCFAN